MAKLVPKQLSVGKKLIEAYNGDIEKASAAANVIVKILKQCQPEAAFSMST